MGENARRLAVVDLDVDAIIATHVRDRKVAAWLQDAAEALAEIGEVDLAIDWAKQAADFDGGHQALKAAGYWCDLLARHRPKDELAARLAVFRRWPSSSTAEQLRRASGQAWLVHRDEVLNTLARSPRDAVVFAQHHLGDVELAWTLAHNLGLADAGTWAQLTDAYEKVDPLGVLSVLRELVLVDLRDADSRVPACSPTAGSDAEAGRRYGPGNRGRRTHHLAPRRASPPTTASARVRRGRPPVTRRSFNDHGAEQALREDRGVGDLRPVPKSSRRT